ncbi:hypothetical protein LTR70_002349 [Exophiala xenobiotica]|nr:hypothetical protein LTR70_002349 [Exophiala xenobiotica]
MGRLTDHFEHRTRETHNEGWSELWESNEESLWDRGMPSPALIDFLEKRPEHLPAAPSGRRLRALVPACGRGYEVVVLALHGFDAYGVEVSQTAVDACEVYATAQLGRPEAYNFGPGSSSAQEAGVRGKIKFMVGDFFKRDWEAECREHGDAGFDLIYDYTFLCAILPEMRLDWARRVKELLAPEGILVCLEFPMYKDVDAAGPPYGLKGVYWDLLVEGGNGIVGGGGGRAGLEPKPTGQEGKLERGLYYQPGRTYEVGEGTDMVSVWRWRRE